MCLALEHCITTLTQCDAWVAKSSKSWKHSAFPCIPPGSPSSYVREEVNNFIQPCLTLIALCYGSHRTHLIANIFEFISETHPYSEGDLINIILVVHLTTNHLGYEDIMAKHLFKCVLVGIILIYHYCIQVQFVISLCNLAKNIIKQLPEETNFTCRFTFASIVANLRMYNMAGWHTNNANASVL